MLRRMRTLPRPHLDSASQPRNVVKPAPLSLVLQVTLRSEGRGLPCALRHLLAVNCTLGPLSRWRQLDRLLVPDWARFLGPAL